MTSLSASTARSMAPHRSPLIFGILLLLTVFSLPVTESIVNGTVVTSQEAPYIVSLQWNSRHKCNGILLNRDTVLTVAHCYPLVWVWNDPLRVSVLLGSLNSRNADQNSGRRVSVRTLIWPPNFPEAMKSASILRARLTDVPFDYLILKLSESVQQSSGIAFAPLPRNVSGLPPEGDYCTVYGWGRYQYPDIHSSSDLFSGTLRKGEMVILSHRPLWRNAPLPTTVFSGTQLWVNGMPRGIPCFGDSGGPLMCQDRVTGGRYSAGLVLGGPFPCNKRRGTIMFMRIFDVLTWIMNNL